MTNRIESAAETRRALLRAAAELLDAGGPEAVTLREVGSLAGVSRNAPYRHFTDKEGLLIAVAVDSWDRVADQLKALDSSDFSASVRLQHALMMFVELARVRPHLYRLMFVIPNREPLAGARSAGIAQEALLSLVADVIGEDGVRTHGALLFAAAHGLAGLEMGGHLNEEKWGASTEQLIENLVALTAGSSTTGPDTSEPSARRTSVRQRVSAGSRGRSTKR